MPSTSGIFADTPCTALESLISTLRSHLARLTSELSDHQRLLGELRTLRDSDARALAEKSKDIDTLRQQVERLAGEVEVLRGVIEEGLRERRHAREASVQQAQAEANVEEPSDEEEVTTSDEEDAMLDRSMHPAQTLESLFNDSEDEEEHEDQFAPLAPAGRRSPVRTAMQPSGAADRSMALRTDHATVGSSVRIDDSTKPFVDLDEVDRISTDLQDRRSERSASMMQRSQSLSLTESRGFARSVSRSASPALSNRSSVYLNSRRSSPVREDEPPVPPIKETEAARTNIHQRSPSPVQQDQPDLRPSGPTPAYATRPQARAKQPEPSSSGQRPAPAPAETPFPQIHGERLERLFFSAPEHNAQTCTVCHRRVQRQSSKGAVNDQRPFWSVGPSSGAAHEHHAEDDEGFAEGSDNNVRPGPALAREGCKGKARERDADHLPPQTVLSRVIRELEDDFTHFKRYVSRLQLSQRVFTAHFTASTSNWRISTSLWMPHPM